MHKLAWHFDFHSHKNIRIGHKPDAAAMARTLQSCGIEEIITFAKGHDGFAYYPTRVGTAHPRMVGDCLGDVVRECQALGIRVLAYLSFGIDGESARKHNDWAQVGPNGPLLSKDHFINVCPFTPYLDKLMLPMIGEILDRYPVDGFFFDTMGAMGICYCDCCRREFRKIAGLDIPRDAGDPNWGAYGRFRHDRAFAVVERVGRFIAARKPDAKTGFNHIGSFFYPEKPPAGISCLTMDFATPGPQSLQASLCSAHGSTAQLPADIMSTIFNQGWADWSPRPFAALEQEAVAVWARNCRPYIGDRLHPENRLDPISIRAMQFMKQVADRVAREYPAADAKLAPDILVLHEPRSIYGADMGHFAASGSSFAAVEGAHHLLLDAGANFTLVASCHLEAHLSGARLVVVPEAPFLDGATAATLRGYVEAGGRVLVVGNVPRIADGPWDVIGVDREDKPWQDHIYLPLWEASAEKSPVLVRGDFHKLNPTSAATVLPAIRPYDCDHGMRFGHGIGPASDQPSEFAALTRRRLGKGEVWYLEAPIFSDYSRNANWTQIDWVRSLLDRMIAPAVQVISACGSVEVVAHADAQATWAFLVNHAGEQSNGEQRWTRTFAPVPAIPISLRVRDSKRRLPRSVTSQGAPLAWQTKGDCLEIDLTLDSIWRVVRLDWG